MIDYIVRFTYWISDINMSGDTIITIKEGIIEDKELLEDVILENLKEKVDQDGIQIVDFEELIQNDNLYRFEYKDVYGNPDAKSGMMILKVAPLPEDIVTLGVEGVNRVCRLGHGVAAIVRQGAACGPAHHGSAGLAAWVRSSAARSRSTMRS